MRVGDVMLRDVVTVSPDDGIKEAARRMIEAGVPGLPVVEDGRVVGMITEADFLEQEAEKEDHHLRLLDAFLGTRRHRPLGDTVREAMRPVSVTIGRDAPLAEAARIMKQHGVDRLPVVVGDGSLVGLVSRTEILHAFVRSDEDIGRELSEDVARRILRLEGSSLAVDVVEGVVRLSGTVPTRTDGRLLEEMARRIEGVIRVESELAFEVDDTARLDDHQSPI